jgi:hypothetical protein
LSETYRQKIGASTSLQPAGRQRSGEAAHTRSRPARRIAPRCRPSWEPGAGSPIRWRSGLNRSRRSRRTAHTDRGVGRLHCRNEDRAWTELSRLSRETPQSTITATADRC